MQAFELTDEMTAEGFAGGTVAYGHLGMSFDIKAALDEGNGVIVTDDPLLGGALAGYPGLRTCEAPDDAVPVAAPGGMEAVATVEPGWTPQNPPEVGVDIPPAPPGADEVAAPEKVEEPKVEEKVEEPVVEDPAKAQVKKFGTTTTQ